MIVDFHAHIFPDKIAHRAVGNLEQVGRVAAFTDGTLSGLKSSMKEAGVTHSIILPIVTKPKQFDHLNDFAWKITHEEPDEDGLSIISFGGVHPDSANYKGELLSIKRRGLKGIKIHPTYQNTYIDDIKYEHVIDYAIQIGLVVSIHCGRDLGFPEQVYATPKRVRKMIREVFPGRSSERLVLAHLGGHDMEDESEAELIGGNYYMDLAYVLRLARPEQILRMCRNHGIDKILFATDTPWSGQKRDVDYIKTIGFTEQEMEKILWVNAFKLLRLRNIAPSA